MAIGAIAAMVAPIVFFEGLAAVLKYIEGDPEADVQTALEQLSTQAQNRFVSVESATVRGQEDTQSKLAGFNAIPTAVLSRAQTMGQDIRNRSAPNTDLVDFVTRKLGVDAEQLRRASAPSRVGDMSIPGRTMGRSFPASPPGGVPNGQ
jgi:hypothetical protein